MNKLTTIVIGAVAVIALIAAFVYDQSPKLITGAQGPQGPRGEQGVPGPAGKDGKDGITRTIVETKTVPALGAVSGPDIFSPYLGVNGLKEWYYRTTFTNTSSTTCSFQSPSATTSPLYASFLLVTNGSTTPIVIGWGAGPMATTTKLSASTDINIAGGQGGGITASSTADSFIVPPNTWINYKTVPGTVAQTGSCALVLGER